MPASWRRSTDSKTCTTGKSKNPMNWRARGGDQTGLRSSRTEVSPGQRRRLFRLCRTSLRQARPRRGQTPGQEHEIVCLPGSYFGQDQEKFVRLAFANVHESRFDDVIARLIASQSEESVMNNRSKAAASAAACATASPPPFEVFHLCHCSQCRRFHRQRARGQYFHRAGSHRVACGRT